MFWRKSFAYDALSTTFFVSKSVSSWPQAVAFGICSFDGRCWGLSRQLSAAIVALRLARHRHHITRTAVVVAMVAARRSALGVQNTATAPNTGGAPHTAATGVTVAQRRARAKRKSRPW